MIDQFTQYSFKPINAFTVPTVKGSLQEYSRATLRRLILATILGAYSWFVYVFLKDITEPNWLALLAPFLLVIASMASLVNLRGRLNIAVGIVIAGFILASLSNTLLEYNRISSWLSLVAVIVSGMLSGPIGATVVAVFMIMCSWLMPTDLANKLELLREIIFGLTLVWAMGGYFYRALLAVETSEAHFVRIAKEATDRQGELHRTSKTLRDMYALLERTNRELEIARREAEEAKEIKARFAANVSHELRTPLNLIMGFSHTMYASPEVYGNIHWPPALRMDIHEIYSASRHLLSMIDDILDLSRIEAQRLPLKLEPTNLKVLIEEAVATGKGLLRGSSVKLVMSISDNLPEVLVDRTRIRQVILNLINNAIRFTDYGLIKIDAVVKDGEIEVSVSDTGTGIPEEDQTAIFDEFSQAHGPITSGRGGTGLGLAVCKQFVQLHGGRIYVSSKVGQGSTFTFSIPLPKGGRIRSRLAYYLPDGWSPPLFSNPLGKSVVVLAPDETSARQVARGITDYRTIPLSNMSLLPDIVQNEHPAGVVLVKDPLVPEEGPLPDDIWQVTNQPDLGVIEYMTPIESVAKHYLQVDGYMTKPVQAEQLLAVLKNCCTIGNHFLIVDDDAGFRTLMERVLTSAFPNVVLRTCGMAEDALEVLAQEQFDVLLLDLVMTGMSGLEFLVAARQRRLLNGTKVIISTGASYTDELARVFPSKLSFSKKSQPRGTEWFSAIRSLLDVAPPDYSRRILETAPKAKPLQ